jgi:hypothetical protein
MHTGHEAQPNRSAYGLCDLSLVLWPQSRVSRVLYPPRLGHVLGHHCEILHSLADDPSSCV